MVKGEERRAVQVTARSIAHVVGRSGKAEAVADLVEHHRNEVDLIHGGRTIRAEIPGRTAVEAGTDFSRRFIDVVTQQTVGQRHRIDPAIQWKRAAIEDVGSRSPSGPQRQTGQVLPHRIDGDGHVGGQQPRPDVHRILEGRLGLRRETVVVHREGGHAGRGIGRIGRRRNEGGTARRTELDDRGSGVHIELLLGSSGQAPGTEEQHRGEQEEVSKAEIHPQGAREKHQARL